jgi:hypothetical protein
MTPDAIGGEATMSPDADWTRWCHNCGVEITWAPVRAWGRYYCCAACLRGEGCDCPPPLEDGEESIIEEHRGEVERVW